jgi:hypothetical protein
MGPINSAAVVVVAAALCVPALASAQAPVASFWQLGDRLLMPGDTVWVTDAQGREVKGKIGSITPWTITLEDDAAPSFDANEVRVIRRRDPGRRTWTGAAIGAIAACAAYPKDDPLRGDACLMAIGLTWMPGFGAGALVGAAFPGQKQTIFYRAPGPEGRPAASPRASIGPIISARAKGVAVAFSF